MATTITGKLIAIVGPTASGKTDLAVSLARKYRAEIICADSRTIYRGMDIGTAKPSLGEQRDVPHHMLDIVDPGEILSAAAFKALTMGVVGEIWGRGNIPMMVGGSGLYLDSVLYDFQFPSEADPAKRAELDVMDLDELCELLAAADSDAYERTDLANPRRVIRAIETAGQQRSRAESLGPDKLVIGLSMSKEVAQDRISRRVEKMLDKGFIDEVRRIGESYGWDSPAMSVIGYAAFKDVILGSKSVVEATADFVRGDMALYKKQMTWFKRNLDIRWVDNAGQANELVEAFKV